MAKPLVIVESPAKAKTIGRFLGNSYMVEASYGHVRDLPKNADEIPAEAKGASWARLGVNVDADFTPLYVVSGSKKDQVQKLKSLLKEASMLYLATDEDREGESISWHLLEILKPKVPVRRLVFHEITQEAIQDALANPRSLDLNLVSAQETRRIVDRLYGYEVSPLLWKKVAPKLSAGRVQSVAVRLLVERERARMSFVPASWWDLEALFEVKEGRFVANLIELDGKKLASGKDFDENTGKLTKRELVLLDKEQTTKLAVAVSGKTGKISRVEAKPYREKPAPPFTTSTLQQEANRKLKWSARRTMQVAQKLYENGWITYMRTDSVALSDQAIQAARTLIEQSYGKEYLPLHPRTYKNTAKNAQEAHEAIRPAGSSFRTLEEAKRDLESDDARLYELIWKRTVACQMEDATGRHLSVGVELALEGVDWKKAAFLATGKTIEFPGYRRAYVEGSDDPDAELADQERLLPAVKLGDPAKAIKAQTRSHTTQPPARLTEATLVKELEGRGIGRPSTYASIIETILEREYVVKRGNALVPTFTAFAVTKLLEQSLANLVDYDFTARMEDQLDEIALGRTNRLSTLQRFYAQDSGLVPQLKSAEASVDPRTVCTIPIGEHEGQEVVVRVGRFGPFVAAGEKNAPVPPESAPDEATVAWAMELLAKKAEGPRSLGFHPDGSSIYLLDGRFGPYVQKGEAKDGEKPPRASLLPGMSLEEVDLKTALSLLTLPRTLGADPENSETIIANNGRYGPYISRGKETRNVPPELSVLSITLDQALKLLAEAPKRGQRTSTPVAMKELGQTPGGAKVLLKDGKFGPYVTDGTTNATVPKSISVEHITLDDALELIEKRLAAGGTPKPTKKPKEPELFTSKTVKAGESTAAKKANKTASKASSDSPAKASKRPAALSALPEMPKKPPAPPVPSEAEKKRQDEIDELAAMMGFEISENSPLRTGNRPTKTAKAPKPTQAAKPAAPKAPKLAPKPAPPAPVLNRFVTVKASKVNAPISALPPEVKKR
jgi:DNA topoisomerase-1